MHIPTYVHEIIYFQVVIEVSDRYIHTYKYIYYIHTYMHIPIVIEVSDALMFHIQKNQHLVYIHIHKQSISKLVVEFLLFRCFNVCSCLHIQKHQHLVYIHIHKQSISKLVVKFLLFRCFNVCSCLHIQKHQHLVYIHIHTHT